MRLAFLERMLTIKPTGYIPVGSGGDEDYQLFIPIYFFVCQPSILEQKVFSGDRYPV